MLLLKIIFSVSSVKAAMPNWQNPNSNQQFINNSQNFHPQSVNLGERLKNETRERPPAGSRSTPVFSNSIDVSNARNREFLAAINLERNQASISEWIGSSPETRAMVEKVLSNYGLLPLDKDGTYSGLTLPSPQYLTQTVEESLAVHESFKRFLKKLLERVQEYLTECSMLIFKTVIELESKYKNLLELTESSKASSSELLKTQYIKEVLDLATETKATVRRYKSLKKWRSEVTGKLEKNL